MTGYSIFQKITRAEDMADKLGFKLVLSRYGEDEIALVPDEDRLPIYANNSHIFSGSLEQMITWLNGALWAREYDTILLGKTHNTKRTRKEQDIRNKKLVDLLKEVTNG